MHRIMAKAARGQSAKIMAGNINGAHHRNISSGVA